MKTSQKTIIVAVLVLCSATVLVMLRSQYFPNESHSKFIEQKQTQRPSSVADNPDITSNSPRATTITALTQTNSAGLEAIKTATHPGKGSFEAESYFDNRLGRVVKVVKREVMVRFKKGIADQEIERFIKENNLSLIQRKERLGIYRFRIPMGTSVSAFIDAHAKNGNLTLNEPNFIASAMEAGPITPDDPYLASQWALSTIQAPKAWETTTGSPNVIIAVLDTGISLNHPDLREQLVPGYDFVNGDDDPSDDHGHGTHVSGIIAAKSNNAVGIAGISWGSRVMPLKVMSANGEGAYSDVIDGILFAAEHGARVLNLSIGGYSNSRIMGDAVEYAHSKNAVIIAAAGNEATSAPIYPAAYSNVIAVSATDSTDHIWSSSNHGTFVRLSAPGVDILSTTMPDAYGSASGTSAATALAAGVAGLVISENQKLSNSQVEQILYTTADDLGDEGQDNVFGFGRLNAAKSLQISTIQVHDLAVTQITVSPRSFTKGETVRIAASIQNQGTSNETAFDVRIFINEHQISENQTVPDMSPTQITETIFEWVATTENQPELTIKASVSIVPHECDITDNTKSIAYKQDPDGESFVLYKNIPFVHSWTALQGYNLLPEGRLKTELNSYLRGGATDSQLFGTGKIWFDQYSIPAQWSVATNTGDSVLEGAWEEDEDIYGLTFASLRHFWDPDKAYNDGIGLSDSNLTQAQHWWEEAKAIYPTNKPLAYYYLGRVAHLLGDMGVPEHVHNEDHMGNHLGVISDKDKYSNYEEYTKLFYRNFTAVGSAKSTDALPLSFPEYPDAPATFDENLGKLFYNQAQFTQHFDSSRANGNKQGYSGTQINLGISEENGSSNMEYPAISYLTESGQPIDNAESNDGIDPNTTPIIVWQKLGFGYYDYKSLNIGPIPNSDFYIDIARGKGQIMYPASVWDLMDSTLLNPNFDRLKVTYTYRSQLYTQYISNPKDTLTYRAVPDRKLAIQMAAIFPENIRYVAGLYQLFWRSCHYTISGRITNQDNASGVDGITVTFSNGEGSTTTSGGGYYSHDVTKGWAGRVTVTSSNGTLTPSFRDYVNLGANSPWQNYTWVPPVTNATLVSVSISGPSSINEGSNGTFTAKASFSDGTTPTVSPIWSCSPTSVASISSSGILTAGTVSANTNVTVTGSYTSGTVTKTKSATMMIVNSGDNGGALSQELVVNGAFSQGSTGWQPASAFYADNRFATSHSPGGYAYLSNSDGSSGNNLYGEMTQYISLPANATKVTLSYWYRITTTETSASANDTMTLQVLPHVGALDTIDSRSNLNANSSYQLRTFDITRFKGQQILIAFAAITNGSYPTTFRIDDVSVVVNLPTISASSMILTCNASPSSTFPGFPVTVSGSAIYNNGGGSVAAGTATISLNGQVYSASISGGSYTRQIYAPAGSGNYVVNVVASDGLGRSGSASANLGVQAGTTASEWIIDDSVICADIDSSSTFPEKYPDDIREVFSSTDRRIYSYILFEHVEDEHVLSFKWYRPDGTHYDTATQNFGEDGYIYDGWYVYCYYYIEGYDIADIEGKWKVKIYIDGSYVRTETFTVRYEMRENRMTEDIQDADPWDPINPKSIFSQADTRAYTWSKLDNVAEALEIKWVFYEPNGSVYDEFTDVTDDPGNGEWFDWYKLWGWVDISGTAAATKCGDWRVEVFVKDAFGSWDLEYIDDFRIIEAPSQPPTCMIASIPENPAPGQNVILGVSVTDNTYLKNITAFWRDSTEHSKAWMDLTTASFGTNLDIGSFADGQRVEYWVVATDTSGNVTESSHHFIDISEPRDTNAPVVFIDSPTVAQVFTTSSIVVSGTAIDPGSTATGVSAIQVKVNGGEWRQASGTTSWNIALSLSTGTSLIEVRGTDAAGNISGSSYVYAIVQLAAGGVFNDFTEGGAGDWSSWGRAWSLSTENFHSANHSWTDSPGGNYQDNQNSSLVSPSVDLRDVSSAVMTFWHRYEFGTGDAGNVWIRLEDGTFTGPVAGFYGSGSEWRFEIIDLTNYAGQIVQIYFQLYSDTNGVADGWHIDDVLVSEQPPAMSVVVSNTNNSGLGSLRDAVETAPIGRVITFDSALNGQSIQLTTGQILISKDMEINASSLPQGIQISGGGVSRVLEISSEAEVTIDRVTIRNGYVSESVGGGIRNSGTLLMRDSMISGNASIDYYWNGHGGGIFNEGSLQLLRCGVVSNSVIFGEGGGIYNSGNLTICNSTIALNSVEDGLGGGLVNYGSANVVCSTLSGNQVTYGYGGGIFNVSAFAIENIIAAKNHVSENFSNIVSLGSDEQLVTGVNFLDGDPLLAPLGYYGGLTLTMPPLSGSPVIDAGLSTANTPTTDQRLGCRLVGSAIEIGAVETTPLEACQSWVAGKGLTGSDAQLGAMPFDDGVTNLLKYAFNMNGGGADVRSLVPGSGAAGLPSLSRGINGSATVMRFEYLRRKNSGLTYIPKQAATLVPGSWLTMSGTTTVTDVDAGWERVVISQPDVPGGSLKRFFRVEASLP